MPPGRMTTRRYLPPAVTGSPAQNRAALGLATLLGVFAAIVGGIVLLPLLESPLGFLATGVVGALPTLALALAAILAAAGFLAWLLSG